MKLSLFIVGFLPLFVRATEQVGCPVPPDVGICLYTCTATPTIVYTTTSVTTVTRKLPCATLTIEPGPAKEKRVEAARPCPTNTKPIGCGSCPSTTTAKTSVTTATSTVTKYKPCPTKWLPPVITPRPTLY
ncbi:hypothetical protein M408DRAFT_219916 [Serendipita vermifera MAFF 305830]|uniref:Uncharacterized protein n=1 Tax=Serendipita vermifera MAFF 305830 TaxID=933852 RepID=A0A0C3B6N9_SERVB|nr:hypothetical protein M408DRAFT_219916 [Serendipita vermifera MAFF 305830]